MPIDYKKYPKNWLSEIRPRILMRAGHNCEICGLGNGQTVWSVELYVRRRGTGRYGYQNIWFSNKNDAARCQNSHDIKIVVVVLTVAHLDHDEENHDVKDDRLAAMCQMCHLKYDAKEKGKRILNK